MRVGEGQAGAAQFLEQVEQDLALAEAVEEHGHGADVERMVASHSRCEQRRDISATMVRM